MTKKSEQVKSIANATVTAPPPAATQAAPAPAPAAEQAISALSAVNWSDSLKYVITANVPQHLIANKTDKFFAEIMFKLRLIAFHRVRKMHFRQSYQNSSWKRVDGEP